MILASYRVSRPKGQLGRAQRSIRSAVLRIPRRCLLLSLSAYRQHRDDMKVAGTFDPLRRVQTERPTLSPSTNATDAPSHGSLKILVPRM